MNKRTFVILWLLCLAGAVAVLPYAFYLGNLWILLSLPAVLLQVIGQAAVIYGLVLCLSYIVIPRTDLKPFELTFKSSFYPGAVAGLAVGFILYFFDWFLFASAQFDRDPPPVWAGALASFYGAINEEVLLRLCLFTLVYFLLWKVLSKAEERRTSMLWTTNIIVALVFALLHLPMAQLAMGLSLLKVLRVLVLNTLAGMTFGWLYWTRGIWCAMIAHFFADLVIHVLL